MKPSFTTASATNKRLWVVLFFFAALLLCIKVMSTAGIAQSEERIFKADLPKHLPLKLKIVEAQQPGFKRLDNERWLRDFELEVTNIGDKPIFYLYLLLRLPETKASMGTTLVYPLRYGRSELSDIEVTAGPEDVPIKPGQTHVFKIHRGQVMAWEKQVREKNRPQPSIVELAFQKLSFGDRTGYGGPDGQKVPHPPYQKSALGRCNEQLNKAAPEPFALPFALSVGDSKYNRLNVLPASPLPVDLFSALLGVPETLDLECCPGVGCSYLSFSEDQICYNCPNQTRVQSRSCSFAFAFCLKPVFSSIECYLDNGEPYLCPTIDLMSCATPTPTPTPTPSPSPSECNCSDPNAPPADCSTGTPRCPIGEEARNGCCYRLACDEPRPTPAPCPAGYFPTRLWRDFPICEWSECIPLPPSGGGCFEISADKSMSLSSASFMNPNCCDDNERMLCFQGGGEWYESQCACYSPIVIDVSGDGFNLTTGQGGVMFDIPGDGIREQISWTAANSDDSWLALDRNANGLIDNGRELFGSSTPQPYLSNGESKHGFRALALFDTGAYGGNGDGKIDNRDSVFYILKLWQDRNHNGISEAEELQSLSTSVIRSIELKYRESRRKDRNGNWFRYRAKVHDASGAHAGRWAWDVFLQKPD